MGKKKNTQQEKILQYMRVFGEITSMEAFSELGCTRLAAQVFALKQKGYPIITRMVSRANKNGELKNYASYMLADC